MTRSKLTRWMTALTLAWAGASPVQASVIDFEDVPPGFLTPSISGAGYQLTSNGTGFSGVDSAAAFSIFANAPDNSTGQFLYALNDDSVTLKVYGAHFVRLDAAFIAPLQFAPGTEAGMLQIVADTSTGMVELAHDFGMSGASGSWGFFGIETPELARLSVNSLTFSACVYDGSGACVRDASLSQFALDNLQVPEPGSAALVLLALGLMAATRRPVRQQDR